MADKRNASIAGDGSFLTKVGTTGFVRGTASLEAIAEAINANADAVMDEATADHTSAGSLSKAVIDIKTKTDTIKVFSCGRATVGVDETGYLIPAGLVMTYISLGTNLDLQVKNVSGVFTSYNLTHSLACDGASVRVISSSGTFNFAFQYWTIS